MVDVLRNDESIEFFDGTARGELMIKRCDSCGQFPRLDAIACSKYHAITLSWTESSGRGSLVSSSVMRGEPSSVVGLVELDEGPWLHGRLVNVETDSLALGDPFLVDFEQAGEEKTPI